MSKVYSINIGAHGDVSMFPLSLSSRHLMDAQGRYFLMHGTTPWSAITQLTRDEMVIYLDDRKAKGFNTLMLNIIDIYFSNNSPAWKNREGYIPFATVTTSTADYASPNSDYFSIAKYFVEQALEREMFLVLQPSYLGGGGATEGWGYSINNASSADLFSYGQFLGQNFSYPNIAWCVGGDYGPPNPEKQWAIVGGIQSINSTQILTGHTARTQWPSSYWGGFTGFNFNAIYTDGVEYTYASSVYALNLPFFLIEGYYDGESATPTDCRRQAYVPLLSGGAGHLFGNNPVWGFGEPHYCHNYGPAAVISNYLNSAVTVSMKYLPQLFNSYDWWKLAPTDSMVNSGISSGKSRVVAAKASDDSFAFVWVASVQNFNLTIPGTKRAGWYDVRSGTYSLIGSGYTGTQTFSSPGERVLVLD